MTSGALGLGDKVDVEPQQRLSRGEWLAECRQLPPDWTCRIRDRRDTEIRSGEAFTARVIRSDSRDKVLVVSGSDFGFQPISDRMRPRYLRALDVVASALTNGQCRSDQAEQFSEVKGMFSRSWKHDQWDWFEVYLALDRPTQSYARQIAFHLGRIATALSQGNDADRNRETAALSDSGVESLLNQARERITSSYPRLAKPNRYDQWGTGSNTAEVSHSRMSPEQKYKTASAATAHKLTLQILESQLRKNGYEVDSNEFVDLFCRLKSGPAIFEVKSVTAQNELSQVRSGLAQLYEYRFRHQLTDASLWLVLSRKLEVDLWLIDYLESDRDIRILWVKDQQLQGPSIERLFESGIAARRRQTAAVSSDRNSPRSEGK